MLVCIGFESCLHLNHDSHKLIILGPGDPFLTPDPSVIAESVVETIRYLHSSFPRWTQTFNQILHDRLESAKICRRAGDEVSLVQLWPALLVIAGADPGLRVGAKCQNVKGMGFFHLVFSRF